VVGEIGFGAAELSDGESGIDNGGCGGGAHTPQGTPGRRAGQAGVRVCGKVPTEAGDFLGRASWIHWAGFTARLSLIAESGVSGGGTAFSRNGTRQVTLG
jgi:hypothetical protein